MIYLRFMGRAIVRIEMGKLMILVIEPSCR